MKKNNTKNRWSASAVVYHIYPRSFKDSNGDGIGDIAGIIEKLDYLNDGTENSLGVDAVWLSPVYTSPMKDFGYDVADYYSIDPSFGDMDAFNTLVREVHTRGMKLIMDFVPNHTSVEHAWFLKSRTSKANSKRDWYIWRDPKPDGSSPNNWLSVFGGSAWTLDEKTGQYYLHSFLSEQPDLNWRNKAVHDEMLKVLDYWLHQGVDGFRTDAVYHLLKDERLRDDPENPNYRQGIDDPYDALLHVYSQGSSETLEKLNSFCEILGKHEDTFMVSEAYLDVPGMAELYKACTNKVHAPLNFNFIGIPWSAESYKTFIDEFEISLEPNDVPTYVLGNHDRSRIASRIGLAHSKLAAMLTFTLRGMPFIYYGEEIGMTDVPILENSTLDPFGKRVPGFNLGRDPERTPMQWSKLKNAGFSDTVPWLPVSDNYNTVNVAVEYEKNTSMLQLYLRLIHFRKKSKALLYGDYVPLPLQGNGEVFAFIRKKNDERILILINFSEKDIYVSCNLRSILNRIKDKKISVICNTHCDKFATYVDLRKIHMRPLEGYVITI